MRKGLLLAGASALALIAAGATSAHAGGVNAFVNDSGGDFGVHSNNAYDEGTSLPNTVDSSYNAASGIMHVQQNEGSNNAIDAATAVAANVGAYSSVDSESEVNTDVSWNSAYDTSGSNRTNKVIDSFDKGTAGVATVQQNNGDNNQIGASTAVQATIVGYNPSTSAEAAVNGENEGTVHNNYADTQDATRTNLIDPSFNQFYGVATVQQNNGNNNGIGAATLVTGDVHYVGDMTSEATVNSVTEDNYSNSYGNTTNNKILDSFNKGAAGVVTVQQNNGDNNQIGAATAVHVRTANASYPSGDVSQDVNVSGASNDQTGAYYEYDDYEGNAVTDAESTRNNVIDPAFKGFSGVATVQQNNGNANAISAATSVVGNVGGDNAGYAHGKQITQNVDVNGSLDDNAKVVDDESTRTNSIADNSFKNASGVLTVQQNNGDVNVMGVGTAVAFNAGIDGHGQLANNVTQDVSVWGNVDDAKSVDVHDLYWNLYEGQRLNKIGTGAFSGASGLASVQQNNGSQNVMGIGNAVAANVDTLAHSLGGDDNVSQTATATGGTTEGNEYQVTGFSPLGARGDRTNALNTGAFNGFAGIASVQQNNGDNNVIGAANAVAMTLRSSDLLDNVNESDASTSGDVNNNNEYVPDGFFLNGGNRLNTIDHSFNGYEGIANVQQNNGANNVMGVSNTVTANIGVGSVHHLQDNNLGSVINTASGEASVTWNHGQDSPLADRKNTISNAFNNNASGMMTVQQNNGDNNVMGASNAVAATLNGPGAALFGPATSTATLTSTVANNCAETDPYIGAPGRVNVITSAFNGASGVMVQQQNNGDNNSIQSAVAVTASLGNFSGGNFLSGLGH